MSGYFIQNEDGSVSMDAERWKGIQEDLAWLQAMQHAGVDNWEGINLAQKIFNDGLQD